MEPPNKFCRGLKNLICGPAEMQLKKGICPRLLRFAVKMMRFDYDIRHISGVKNVVADSLSRSPDNEFCEDS